MPSTDTANTGAAAPLPPATATGPTGGFARFTSMVSDETLASLAPRRQTALIRRAAWQLTWPVIAEQSMMTLTQVVSMAMVGRLGPTAIAASSVVFQPFMFASQAFMGLFVATTVLVARSIGAGDRARASAAFRQSLVLACVLGGLTTLAALAWAAPIVRLMGAAPDVVAAGVTYVRAMAPGMAFLILQTMCSAALRGAGDTRTPMAVNLVVNVVNVVLSWALIFGRLGAPPLGVFGAGLATTLSRGIGTALMLGMLWSNRLALGVGPLRGLVPDLPLMKRIFAIGLPSAIERSVMGVGQLLYLRQVAALGTVALATHALGMSIESLSYMPGIGFSVAASTLVGLNLGARRPEIAEKSAVVTAQLAALAMGFMGLVFLVAPGPLLGIYTSDPRIISTGSVAMRVLAILQVPEAIGFVISGALRGAGDTRSVLMVTFAGAWVIRLGLTPVFVNALHWGIVGAWLAMLADWTFRAGILVWLFRRGGWKKIKL
jgi:putative MATE family efflux protein